MTSSVPGGAIAVITVVTALTVVLAAGCGHRSDDGPVAPDGSTVSEGAQMTAEPPPPPGWKLQEAVPTSQQQAQDTVMGYLKKTLAVLPPGTVLDATRYSGAVSTVGCDDNDTRPAAPHELSTWGDLRFPPGTDSDAAIADIGELWRNWGWHVIERRDGYREPNRFGYGPDGYRLQVRAAAKPGYPPTVNGTSPCFPGDVPEGRTPFPMVLTAD